MRRIERLYPGNPYATGMMEATLIGESSRMERLWTDHFRRTGTYHMLVIDGLHITVLAALSAVSSAALFSSRNHGARDHRVQAPGCMRWFPDGTRPPSAPRADSRCMSPHVISIAAAVC